METEGSNLEILEGSKAKRKKVVALYSDAEITMNQLAEILINSYRRKYPELSLVIDTNGDKPHLNNAA
ncbi:MAG: hypothetical protein ACHQRM_15345 [Bacteroidia bacterium]